ncbi:hypothetical protein LUZ62_036845 [Rhynchospora pubera]|uniref:Thiol-disulfide oxidoreductase DCC n=1 Tax=Rhynchospora pubera TaxID=906938 RepID=A0AAV8EXU5_9POAL|nr:hypothetical protein LUZ62_036845 [Rhynchospora pubera]
MASMARIGSILPRRTLLRHSIFSGSSQISSLKERGFLPNNARLDFKCKLHSSVKEPIPTELKEKHSWKVKMLYDGDCPLCMREVNMLKERNKTFEAIKFVDISSKDYSPQENQGLEYNLVMGRIHAIMSDGTVVTDVEAFRKLYEAVGLGWVYAITKYEPVASIANAIYGVWAKYRMQITGRPPLEVVIENRRKLAVNSLNLSLLISD